jgi:thiol-disulfide isomerase/thioredoxin
MALATASLTASIILAACGGGSTPASTEDPSATERPAIETQSVAQEQATPTSPPPAVVTTARTGDEPVAAELTKIAGWINSEPFTIESQRGKVVLVDFWTYTCINCIRTFPFLRDWHEKYADQGLVILGVHTPEFEFEKIRDNVVRTAAEHGLEYAIAQDNDFGTWRAYENRFWPAKYLIDKDGYIRYTHFGEGSYDETEQKIRELLAETGANLDSVSEEVLPERQLDSAAFRGGIDDGVTRELYGGTERNFGAIESRTTPPYVLHEQYYGKLNVSQEYEDPGEHLNNFIYLQGSWINGRESLIRARDARDFNDYIAIRFNATSVNAVMGPGESGPVHVRTTLDGGLLDPSQAGADVQWDLEGNSFVLVDEQKMYRVFRSPEFGGHELQLSPNAAGLELFAYTFGAYEEPADSAEVIY